MLHIVLALYIVCFSLGIAVLILGIMAHQRTGQIAFRHFVLLFSAAVLYLLVDILKIYDEAISGVFGGMLGFITMFFAAAANGLMGFMVPIFSFDIVDRTIPPGRSVVHFIAAVVLIVLGALSELNRGTFFLPSIDAIAIACVLGYGSVILARNFDRIENPHLRSLVRNSLIFISSMLVLMLCQLLLRSLPFSPPAFRDYPISAVFFFVGSVTLLLVYGLRYLFQPDGASPFVLPERFVQKYGISPREGEIVAMMAKGFNNRKIGETLFISALTVRNHVYHIYQKTGVRNKVQLLNLIIAPK